MSADERPTRTGLCSFYSNGIFSDSPKSSDVLVSTKTCSLEDGTDQSNRPTFYCCFCSTPVLNDEHRGKEENDTTERSDDRS